MDNHEGPSARKRSKANERKQRWLAKQNHESLNRIRVTNAASKQSSRQLENLEQTQVRRAAVAESRRQRIALERPDQSQARRAAGAESRRQRIALERPDQSKARRAADAESHRQRIALERPDESQARRAAVAESRRQRIALETPDQSQARRAAGAESRRQRIALERPDQSQARRAAGAKSHRQRIALERPDQSQARRAAVAESRRQRIDLETPDQSQARRAAGAESRRQLIALERPDQSQARRAAGAESRRQRITLERPEQSQARHAKDAEYHRQRIAQETPEQSQARHAACIQGQRFAREHQSAAIREAVINFVESHVDEHNCGQMNIICQFCGSRNFIAERPQDRKFTSCCRKGKVKLPKPTDNNGVELKYPELLRNLLTDKHFREHIRSYNSAVSFASLGAKIIDFPGRGPYVFRIHGQPYHRTSHLQPLNGQAPQYAQLYVFDSTQATEIRERHAANTECRPQILDQIDRFFRQHNRLAHSYKLMREVEQREAQRAFQVGEDIPLVSMVLRRDRRSDQRRYNAPTSNEVAMVFVDEDGEPPFERDIRIYPKNPQDPNQQFINLNILSPNMDPMVYAILFPYGEAGWQPNWQCDAYEGAQLNTVRSNVSMLQFKAANTAIRGDFNPIISAGKLTQQWLVDSYLQVEANNLNYVRQNQQRLRAEQYQGLADHVANMAQNQDVAAGVPVILPPSFEGSLRNMHERCSDAMSIFAKYGAPDLFITFTANPGWPEIIENLRPYEQTSDQPDLVARIFKIKLDSLIDDLIKYGVFGKSNAYVYSIEFQKRGLPHAHILVTLQAEDKFTTAERIDQFVSAEIPTTDNQRLREIVTRCMMHGPCGDANLRASCMDNGKCTKKFPKDFNNNTIPNVKGYPLYRRRAGVQTEVRRVQMDNRYVVPYNPYLTLKYNAHINVEICTSLKAVKYIYKYIFKGFDCANITVTSNGDQVLQFNEINNFINCRYVSAPEAMWRLLESKMHDRSHVVIRLPVHLPNQQVIRFQPGHEEEALIAAQTGCTKLESWFILNERDQEARQWLYTEIPQHYVYVRGKWQKRKRGADKIVSRMYTVSLRDEERFYLRLLLLHIPGATSFPSLRTVGLVMHETFKAAASARGLLESDDEWDRCLSDAAIYYMPRQFREMFAFICCFCQPASPLKLWHDHKMNLTLDYARQNDDNIATNKALHDINTILKEHGLSCMAIGLPSPTGNSPEGVLYDQVQEAREGEDLLVSLNEKQLDAFKNIISSVDGGNVSNRCFYLDGPGGSGKTFLYKTLMAVMRGRGQIVLPFATTGIAATLLKGGRTIHSGFKLPVPLLDTSVSSMRLTSPEAHILRQASLIIIDEITMLPKNGLRCIDKLLREVMGNDVPFGGKVFVIGGDFRQTLPVVPRGTRTDIVERCIKASSLWKNFTSLTLSRNMRSEGQIEHNDWLLRVGQNNLPSVSGIFEESTIEIPHEMVATGDLIQTIFGNVENLAVDDLSKRVIVAPTNAHTLGMNRKVIELMPGEPSIYYSADSCVSEDQDDLLKFPVEFLNEQTPSGMPPHVLLLKKGVIIMLLRNLNPKKGLCNGTRMKVEELETHFIKAQIISECNRGDTVFIPRIDLAPTDTALPFVLRRRQFPILPAYAITINKSQGQTFDHVGIDLQTEVFSHGQLYVALSRSRNPSHVHVRIEPSSQQGRLLNNERQFTKNVVFEEVFQQ